jgi:hypothetical protein
VGFELPIYELNEAKEWEKQHKNNPEVLKKLDELIEFKRKKDC